MKCTEVPVEFAAQREVEGSFKAKRKIAAQACQVVRAASGGIPPLTGRLAQPSSKLVHKSWVKHAGNRAFKKFKQLLKLVTLQEGEKLEQFFFDLKTKKGGEENLSEIPQISFKVFWPLTIQIQPQTDRSENETADEHYSE